MAVSSYNAIGSVTLSSGQTQVTFPNIPQIYTDLILVISGGGSSSGDSTVFRVNGDSGTNYSSTELYGTGSAAGSQKETSATFGRITYSSDFGTTLTSNSIMNFMNYSNNVTNKTVISRSNVPSSTYPSTDAIVSLWRNTASINSILVYPTSGNWLVGTTFNLYGVGANQLKASGGDVIVTDGSYWYHAFKASGTFTPNSSLSCDVLVVAGGGSGAVQNAGAGGAGGYRSTTALSISSATTVTVGAGGAAATNNGGGAAGNNGSNSVFSSITSTGGGGGGGYFASGAAGGSGGGAGGYAGGPAATGGASSPVTSPVQGYAGGNGSTSYDGGGGGGAGGVGGVGTSNVGGNGGVGSNTFSSWLSLTSLGVGGYIAGGGGAGGNTTSGAGGAGGGGAGVNSGVGVSGVPNTGSGGGSHRNSGTSGAGGSGLVIVRYAI